ncbi:MULTISPECIES: Rieske (2Fe-2S) protein [unclassified Haladaptatus]|uniref:Rieske (2Fe-2S) protein n=1 Tax=unclassified Haladaptatus TaxID=2622732 RepID=UPI00209C1B50|nr:MULTISPECIES: Rieske (2Fe-2S) protein [unclassified Haladaptatus]MCO8243422.1 Rieske (2Fe-2S) protein [Haladaptatus sp. AB643]MCO8254829.1 Rieske (2Fe-2S) protein [Haladaptatus sp. AB618]
MKKRFEICPVSELPPGERKITELNSISVGVFNVDGDYYALKNDCPHQRAPLCMGKVTGTTSVEHTGKVNWEDNGHILRCPWHGWEFDIETGRSVFNPHKVRARSFEATVESTDDGSSDTPESTSGAKDCACGSNADEPPVATYEVTVEDEVVVVYL